MIINSLWAENVLKYSTLQLDDIPGRGLIAVIGDNESGKSSIGESICFALFGRTFSLESGDLDKVIRWGESRCSIKLEFTAPSGQRYQVARFLDELGNHGASISRVGEQPLVRGVEEVQARLKDIIGFGYTEFIESFYLAQREITTPHPHSFAVKAMAGVDALEKVAAVCQGELEQAEETAGETEERKADIDQQIEALGLDEGYLSSLEAEQAREDTALSEDRRQLAETRDKAATSERAVSTLNQGVASWLSVPVEASFDQRKQQADDLRRLVEDLAPQGAGDEPTLAANTELAGLVQESDERISAFDALRKRADGYRRWLEYLLGNAERPTDAADEETFAARREALIQQQSRLVSARRTWRILTFTSLLLAVVLWGVSGLSGLAPTSAQAQAIADWLQGFGGNWESLALPALAIAGTIMTLFFLVSIGRGMRLGAQIQGLDRSLAQLTREHEDARREAAGLAGLDAMPLPRAAEMLSRLRDEAIAGRVADFSEGRGAVLLDANKHAQGQAAFKRVTDALEAAMESVKADAGRKVEHRHESIARHASEIARLEEVITGERERVRRHGELTEISQSLAEKIAKLARRIRARKLAIELLAGAIHYISQRFNIEVRNLSADSLPKFTNGRYEHLQIDENLKVRAFSNEKRDFMDLDEISSGTQRQIMLAVRLALSQKLVNSVIQGPQMLFLDEPFAFFDERRTASALKVLPQVSGDFTQIWVTSQTFPDESRFDLYIACNAEESRSPEVRIANGGESRGSS